MDWEHYYCSVINDRTTEQSINAYLKRLIVKRKNSGNTFILSQVLNLTIKFLNLSHIQLLLTHGANPELMFVSKRLGKQDLYQKLIYLQDFDKLELIYHSNPDSKRIIEARDRRGNSHLDYAVRKNNVTLIHKLISFGMDINSIDDNGETVLFKTDEINTIELLLQIGVDISVVNREGITMIYAFIKSLCVWSCEYSNDGCATVYIEKLLSYGAVIRRPNISCTYHVRCATNADFYVYLRTIGFSAQNVTLSDTQEKVKFPLVVTLQTLVLRVIRLHKFLGYRDLYDQTPLLFSWPDEIHAEQMYQMRTK